MLFNKQQAHKLNDELQSVVAAQLCVVNQSEDWRSQKQQKTRRTRLLHIEAHPGRFTNSKPKCDVPNFKSSQYLFGLKSNHFFCFWAIGIHDNTNHFLKKTHFLNLERFLKILDVRFCMCTKAGCSEEMFHTCVGRWTTVILEERVMLVPHPWPKGLFIHSP